MTVFELQNISVSVYVVTKLENGVKNSLNWFRNCGRGTCHFLRTAAKYFAKF